MNSSSVNVLNNVSLIGQDLGKQRVFGVIGQAIFAMLAGILLDWTITYKG